MPNEKQTIANLRKLKSIHNGSYGADIDRAIKALEQEPILDYKTFAKWVAKEVIDEDSWEWNSDAFPEVACRKLNKLGVIDTDGKRWIYENEALEQEPCEDCISREAAINCVTAASMCDPIITQRRLKLLPSVQPKPKTDWVPVSERLPGFGKTVLVTSDGNSYFEEHGFGWVGKVATVAYLTEEGWEMSDLNYDCQLNKITAWMPLPEPYRESEG